jgi:hypothetical protein
MRPTLLALVLCLWGATSFAGSDIWVCKKADGAEIYSNRNLNGECRKLEHLPQLIPAPAGPLPGSREEAGAEAPKPSPAESEEKPVPGRGRRIDPPSEDIITIGDVKATANYNTTLGIATYQADMRLLNDDADWTAEKVCVEVHFRDPGKIFIDVQQIGCLEGLKALENRVFTVVHTGLMPVRLSPAIEADIHVSSVKWVK